MAEAVAEGVRGQNAIADLRTVEDLDPILLLDCQGYIVGSPSYYGQPAAAVKSFFEKTLVVHGRLAGRVGAAFAHATNVGGGNETTCLAICHMLMVHGMLVMGSTLGDHYGPVAVGEITENDRNKCRLLGGRVAKFARRLHDARQAEGKPPA